ncbi:MAG TPA: hypothetical protein VN648_08475, partial [Candidatus Methylomirabilis sp.]|nr:hypothetical protein [Candidatus Methylomirabilis sp.]
MAQSLSKLYVHLIFGTKHREALLRRSRTIRTARRSGSVVPTTMGIHNRSLRESQTRYRWKHRTLGVLPVLLLGGLWCVWSRLAVA